MDETSTSDPLPESTVTPPPKSKLIFYLGSALLLVSLCVSGVSLFLVYKLRSKVSDLSFSQMNSDYTHDNDLLSPDVGTIQFLHHGYSIRFDTITYSQNGLEVTGTLGNPTQLNLSSINLKLSARPWLYKSREKLEKDPFLLYTGDEIGSAQTNVPYLFPGKTQTFSVTIPNVRQTPDGFQIAVSFSGERYGY
jgi:hypothetical protein